MTGSLPASARDCFSKFVTTELTTVGAGQQPITWPVTPYYTDGGPTIDVSTGLGYPKKADDARRHPSVSLLFSDPTGSNMENPPQVLVQGTAYVDDADLAANRERYWRESSEKLPSTRDMHPPKAVRALFNWYYTRLYIKVRPERVFIWAGGDASAEPELHGAHLEEVRSGHSEEPPEEHGAAAGGELTWDARFDKLSEYGTAVISWLAPDGFPLAVRLPIRVDPAGRCVRLLSEPAGIPLLEGRACLTVHRHHPDFKWQQNFQVRGNLSRDDSGWRLEPHKLVGGFELPPGGALQRYRAFTKRMIPYYRTARRRMKTAG